MDTGKFSGIIARSLYLPTPKRTYSLCTYRNGARMNIGADMFAHGAITVIRDGGYEWGNMATAASNNSQNGFETSPTGGGYAGQPDSTPMFKVRMKLMQITVMRCWIGLANFFGGSFMFSDAPADHIAAFRFSTAAGDANWKCFHNDQSGGGTVVDSGVPMVAGATYDLMIRFVTSTSVEFWINGSLVYTATTDLPGAQNLGNVCMVRTLEAVAKNIRVQHALHTLSLG